jgi:hypothetical protein
MVTLTSINKKVCDASRTIIHRANSPTIYARVNELEFHCIYCQPMLLVEFPLYILNHEKHARQMLKNKTNAWSPISFKPSKLLPIRIHCQNGRKGLEGQYSESSSSRCAWPKKMKTHAQIQRQIFGGNQAILRIKDCKQNRMAWWLNFQQKR